MNPREFCRERGLNTAVLLTYSFDPFFFERVILKDLRAGEANDILVVADARQINESSGRWDGQLRGLGRRYQLAPSVTPGSFHPKVMLRLGPEGGAVWVGSGNLTSGGWGANREICCAWAVGPEQDDKGAWVAPFLERVASWCRSGLRHDVLQRALETPWLHEARAGAVEGATLILTGHGADSLAAQLKRRWTGRRFDEVRIFTGSTDENGAFLRWLHDNFGVKRARVVLDQNRASFIEDRISGLPVETSVMHLPGKRPTHAKFYWFEGPDDAAAVMGSANCSAAAWILSPAEGGNIEAVSVYDEASRPGFESILEVFDAEELTPAKLAQKSLKREREERSKTLPQPQVDWDGASGELHIGFPSALPPGADVSLEVDGQLLPARRADDAGRFWVAEVSSFASEQETVFVTVIVRSAEVGEARFRKWVNDLTELRHSSRGGRIADAVSDLGDDLTPGEQQKTLARLQKLSAVLLNDPSSFADPFSSHTGDAASGDGDDDDKSYEPIDPEKFVRSIEYVDLLAEEGRAARTAATTGLSLAGVMRAIFGSRRVTDFDDEVDFADEPETPTGDDLDDNAQYSLRTDATAKRRAAGPADRYKQRLRDDVQKYIKEMGRAELTSRWTATQLVEASAYPLAVIYNGSTGRWVDDEQAQAWAVQVFDILFSHGKSVRGLLDTVRARYREGGKEADFLRIVGDGTLWLALLSSLANLPWKGRNADLKKALALRAVVEASELVASGDGGRMRHLLSRLEEQRARAIIDTAPRTIDALRRLEAALQERLEETLAKQERDRMRYEVGDLLWKPETVWAENVSDAVCGENTEAYLHLRARVARIKTNLFINVTKAVLSDKTLALMLKEVGSLGTKV
jgi:hypothetical protein